MLHDISKLCLAVSTLVVFVTFATSPGKAATLTGSQDALQPNFERNKRSVPALPQSENLKSSKLNAGKSTPFYRSPHLNIRGSPPAEVTVALRESIELECEAGGSPPPEIHWLKDGERISPVSLEESVEELTNSENEVMSLLHPNIPSAPKSKPLGLSMTRSKLAIDCFSRKDVGKYTCIAENAYQRLSSTSDVLLMKRAIPRSQGSSLCSLKNLESSDETPPPRITMWTHTRLEIIGNDVKLFCRASGFPQPEITWIGPNDSPLANGFRYQTLSNGDLLINNLNWQDMGSYTCVAQNRIGSDRISTFLYPAKAD